MSLHPTTSSWILRPLRPMVDLCGFYPEQRRRTSAAPLSRGRRLSILRSTSPLPNEKHNFEISGQNTCSVKTLPRSEASSRAYRMVLERPQAGSPVCARSNLPCLPTLGCVDCGILPLATVPRAAPQAMVWCPRSTATSDADDPQARPECWGIRW